MLFPFFVCSSVWWVALLTMDLVVRGGGNTAFHSLLVIRSVKCRVTSTPRALRRSTGGGPAQPGAFHQANNVERLKSTRLGRPGFGATMQQRDEVAPGIGLCSLMLFTKRITWSD